MTIKNKEDLEKLVVVGRFVANTLQIMKEAACPGMSTKELDFIAAEQFKLHNAKSAPIITYKFPGYTCISVNHIVAHGIPRRNIVLQEGDLVNIDVSAEIDGYFADTGHSFQIPPFTEEVQTLCAFTEKMLDEVISSVKAEMKINQIGKMIYEKSNANGYTVIRNLASHGVGSSLHEYPEDILNYYDQNDARVLKKGMVITIEPFVSTRDSHVHQMNDGWSLTTKNNSYVAQHEHTLIVTDASPIVLTKRMVA